MEVAFGANQTPVIDVGPAGVPGPSGPTDTGLSVATVPDTQVPAVATNGFLVADTLPGFQDIILPRINLVQGTGELKDSFAQGSIIFAQNLEIFRLPVIDKATGNVKVSGTPPVNLTIIGFKKTRFVEKVKGGGRGLIVNTEAEVRATGGTLDYNEWRLKESSGMKRFESLAEAFVLIKRPEHVADDNTVFTFEVGGAKYALALWGMKGSSYTQCAKKVFFTARQLGCLSKGGYPSWNFSISTRQETFNGNTYFVPVAIPAAPSTPEVLSFINGILNPSASAE